MTILLSACLSGHEGHIPAADKKITGFYLVKDTAQRMNDPRYFKHEYKQINKRRNDNYGLQEVAVPTNRIGLAMSGGGIRSSAFHLGILAGLNEEKYKNKSLIDRIDYISSVSGGSWANGAYWANKVDDDLFFSQLDKTVNNVLIDPPYLRVNQNPLTLSDNDKNILEKFTEFFTLQEKEKWENDIFKYYLGNRNVRLNDTESYKYNYTTKPYMIINSTHSRTSELGSRHNLPFQTTADYIGTLIDDEEGHTGWFVNLNANSNFKWENRKWQRYWKFWKFNPGTRQGHTLSLAMAHSSGVVGTPIGLQYHFHLRYKGHCFNELREYYALTDGGKSENLGMLALIERNVDLIIVSHMGNENKAFEDLKLAAKQVKKLFGRDVDQNFSDNNDVIIPANYREDNGKVVGKLLHIRPKNKQAKIEFISELENKGYLDLAIYLKNEERAVEDKFFNDRYETDKQGEPLDEDDKKELAELKKYIFPMTPTFKVNYSGQLIRCYYLYGKFLTKQYLYKEIKNQLNH